MSKRSQQLQKRIFGYGNFKVQINLAHSCLQKHDIYFTDCALKSNTRKSSGISMLSEALHLRK